VTLVRDQISNWMAPRSTRPRRGCSCTGAAGLRPRRGERLLLPSVPPLFADVLARQSPAQLLLPAQKWARAVPGTGGGVWLDARGVARCSHGHARSTLERGCACGCSASGLRKRRLQTEQRRSRAAAVPLAALAASALTSAGGGAGGGCAG